MKKIPQTLWLELRDWTYIIIVIAAMVLFAHMLVSCGTARHTSTTTHDADTLVSQTLADSGNIRIDSLATTHQRIDSTHTTHERRDSTYHNESRTDTLIVRDSTVVRQRPDGTDTEHWHWEYHYSSSNTTHIHDTDSKTLQYRLTAALDSIASLTRQNAWLQTQSNLQHTTTHTDSTIVEKPVPYTPWYIRYLAWIGAITLLWLTLKYGWKIYRRCTIAF